MKQIKINDKVRIIFFDVKLLCYRRGGKFLKKLKWSSLTKGIVFNKLKMATDDETFTACSVCSATTDLKKDNFGWDYCACLDANYCPECSPTNACECGQDGSCECANCATDDE